MTLLTSPLLKLVPQSHALIPTWAIGFGVNGGLVATHVFSRSGVVAIASYDTESV